MAKKMMGWKTRGMNRDLSVTAFNPEFCFENRNLRLGTNEGNTLMSWVCEKGTAPITIVAGNWVDGDNATYVPVTPVNGTPIGTAIINHKLVVFTTEIYNSQQWDRIYVLRYANAAKTQMICKMLYGSYLYNLNFSTDYPIETIVSYESEEIQKVYWTDGNNQPRVINIEGTILNNNSTQFDFVPELSLEEKINVQKQLGASGMFTPGVIQYAFTYYRTNGQESNIFYTTPLYYISHKDRGGSPEDKVDNAFKITVTGVDMNFDFLRIYSIHRTSINATPEVKRIQDIQTNTLNETYTGSGVYVASYLDTGLSGSSVDPMELLYKGGETISAETMEQKDGTLFLGNLRIRRKNINDLKEDIQGDSNTIQQDLRSFRVPFNVYGDYKYANQLSAYDALNGDRSVPCSGFKYGDYYRCGVQFQYKTGKWSDPIFLEDVMVTNMPFTVDNVSTYSGVTVPALSKVLSASVTSKLLSAGYRKARAVVVFPNLQDRASICQGVTCPTLYTSEKRMTDCSLYSQASWFFRSSNGSSTVISDNGTVKPVNTGTLAYTDRHCGNNIPVSGNAYDPVNIKRVEIQGDYDSNHKFNIDYNTVTFHSPDIDFDESIYSTDFSSMGYRTIGDALIERVFSDIDIQTETPTVSNSGSGFVHKSFSMGGDYGIVAGLFYDDYLIDDPDHEHLEKWSAQHSSYKFMVYPWHSSGSLNNDINRNSNLGVRTALLKKKVISNLRYTRTVNKSPEYIADYQFLYAPQLFASSENTILKINNNIYQGNIDTMLIPDNGDGNYFAFGGTVTTDPTASNIPTAFSSDVYWKTFSKNEEDADDQGTWRYNGSNLWENRHAHIGNEFVDLVVKKEPVRMKYKSTPHLVCTLPVNTNLTASGQNAMPVIDIIRYFATQEARQQFEAKIFGGKSQDAFMENIWIPCGDPVKLGCDGRSGSPMSGGTTKIYYDYGDTYYQRYDCLKTYAFTREDINQVVEIGSFMLETRTNIDGRYDRNRGQMNNLNMSPTNFNLINKVYSQQDNFFSYRIQDTDYYNDSAFPNRITWSLTKESGSTTDLWTNITLASTLELDGDKGKVTSLKRLNDMLLCFQDSGISQILYNPNVQIATETGIPIEIANSGKVEGKKYYTDTVGCTNKWTIVTAPDGLYFMESNDKSIYRFGTDLRNISHEAGFNAWCKMYIPSGDIVWNPRFPSMNGKSTFVGYYDKMNQEILFINEGIALAYSQKFAVFTSFYDYGDAPYFCSLDDTGIWLNKGSLWKHQAGNYCRFFGVNKPYSTILIGNPEPTVTKIFTNMEFRACVDNDTKIVDGKYTPLLPFDTLEAWNEYQHGIAYLRNARGHQMSMHHTLDNNASLLRKFRIWRCDIPRDNADGTDTFDETFDETFHMLARISKHPQDRIRNPWVYIRLRKAAADEVTPEGIIYDHLERTEIHDVMMTYFD